MQSLIDSSRSTLKTQQLWEHLGEQIDRLISVEFRPSSGSVPQGLVVPLYNTLRSVQQHPLSTLAANLLLAHAKHNRIMIVTGAGIAPALPAGETDGPPGAAVLADVLNRGISSRPVFVTEDSHYPAVRNCLNTLEHPEISVELFSPESAASEEANRLLDLYNPACVIFVERDGRNNEGRYHGVRGNCRPEGSVAKIDELAIQSSLRGIKTIGIGDGGNEVGFGIAQTEIASLFPDGAVCHSDCVSGRITSVATDVCVSASVSNWGAYGVAAGIAAATQRPELLPRPEDEALLIDACLRGGARDGASGKASRSVDGISLQGNRSILTLLHELTSLFCA